MEGVTKRRQFFVLHFLLKLECDPQEIISREICLHSRRPLSEYNGARDEDLSRLSRSVGRFAAQKARFSRQEVDL